MSSTTPDVPASPHLGVAATLAWGLGLGAGVGALLLRPSATSLAPALLRGARSGALLGGGVAAVLLGLDRLTNGEVATQLALLKLDRRAQILFVLKHPTMPWLGPTGLDVAKRARAAQYERFGRREPLDGPQDAFRHAYAAALFAQRLMHEHQIAPATAHALAVEAGAAHEADGQDNNDDFSRSMDGFNNLVGARLSGNGRAADGTWHTDAELQEAVLDAMASGALRLVDRGRSPAQLVASSREDLPPTSD